MADRMRAVVYGATGPFLTEVPVPDPEPAQVRVRVLACALNRADLYMAEGRQHGGWGGPGTVLGLEWAGVIDDVGDDVPSRFYVGQRVMGSGRGAFADYAVADWGRVLPMPDCMAPSEAVALPIALQTMHDALVTHGRLQSGETLLLHGASTAVGLMGWQIARYLKAAWIGGSSTSAAKRRRLLELGLDMMVNPTSSDWSQDVRMATRGQGVDLVVDMLSGPMFNETLKATAIKGRIVNVGRLAGRTGDFDFDLHAQRRVQYCGVTFRTRTVEEVRDITRRMWCDLYDPLMQGALRLPIDRRFTLEQCPQALAYMRTNEHFGKITLKVA